jgi:hypothetical protein
MLSSSSIISLKIRIIRFNSKIVSLVHLIITTRRSKRNLFILSISKINTLGKINIFKMGIIEIIKLCLTSLAKNTGILKSLVNLV